MMFPLSRSIGWDCNGRAIMLLGCSCAHISPVPSKTPHKSQATSNGLFDRCFGNKMLEKCTIDIDELFRLGSKSGP